MARRQTRRGAILVLAAVLLIVIFGFVAFTIDVGYLTLTRTQLQSAVDAAALAGAVELLEEENRLEKVRASAVQLGRENLVAQREVALDPLQDIEIGRWDFEQRTFTPLEGDELADADAVRVTAVMTEDRGSAINLFFAPLIGHRNAEMRASAVATIGEERPRDIMLVIDLSGSMAEHNRIAITRNAAIALIDEIMPTDRVGLSVYSYPRNGAAPDDANKLLQLLKQLLGLGGADDEQDITGFLERPLDFDHSKVRNRIPQLQDGMYAQYTNIAGGMRVALDEFRANLRPTARERSLVQKYMVLMTDGHANRSEPPSNSPTGSIEYYAQLALEEEVIIHGITLGAEADQQWVRRAAEITGGEYYHVDDGDSASLFEVYRRIGQGDRKAKLVK